MRHIFLGIALLVCAGQAPAQMVGFVRDGTPGMFQGIVRSSQGMLLEDVKKQEVTDGTNYFKNQWLSGTAEFTTGAVCRNVPVKLNLVSQQLHYMDGQQEMIATSAVRRLWLTDTLSGKTYMFCHKWMVDSPGRHAVTWYQVLVQGAATLLLAHKKTIEENTTYGSAVVERTTRTDKTYYLWLNGRLTEIKKWRSLPDYLTGKESKADGFIDKNDLNGRTEADWIKLVEWYNGNG